MRNLFRSLVLCFLLVFFVGCAEKEIYIDRPMEVKVPVKCEVPPVECFPNQVTYTEKVKEMRLCIERYKQAIQVCSKGKE